MRVRRGKVRGGLTVPSRLVEFSYKSQRSETARREFKESRGGRSRSPGEGDQRVPEREIRESREDARFGSDFYRSKRLDLGDARRSGGSGQVLHAEFGGPAGSRSS